MGYAASHRAISDLKTEGKMPKRVHVRSSKYLNNGIEQDHRRVKQRIRPMLGFKRFDSAVVTISGIELAAKIRKHQFKVGKLPGRPKTIPAIWAAVVAAQSRRSDHLTRLARFEKFAPEPRRVLPAGYSRGEYHYHAKSRRRDPRVLQRLPPPWHADVYGF